MSIKNANREVVKRPLICNDAGKEDYLLFQTRCIRKFGSAAGVFLRQLVYWTGKGHDPDGWIYKTQTEMEEETGLSRKQQEKARKILLAKDAIEEKRAGVPRRLWYRVDLEALMRIMETPHSTLNQRKGKRGTVDDSEQMNREGDPSLSRTTDPSCEVGSTVLASEAGSISPLSEDRTSVLASAAPTNDRAITESTTGTTAESSQDNHASENPLLQSGASLASRGSTPNKTGGSTASPELSVDNRELTRIIRLLSEPGSKAHAVLELHLKDEVSLRDLAGEVCHTLTGSRAQAKSYIEPVWRVVHELGTD